MKLLHTFCDYQMEFTTERNEEINQLIRLFVNAMSQKNQSADHYASKRNTTVNNAIGNIGEGKKSEFFVEEYLRTTHGYPICPVDLEIREGKNKGWRPDFIYQDIDPEFPTVHVKGSLGFQGVDTWLIQYSDDSGYGGYDPMLSLPKDTTDLIALVILNGLTWGTCKATVKAVFPWALVLNDSNRLLESPMLAKHKNKKLALYYNTLLKHLGTAK